MSRKTRSRTPAGKALRLLLWPLRVLAGILIFFDELLRPLYRPLVSKIFELAFFRWLDRSVKALPRWAILIVFAVPFMIAEPPKLVAVFLIAKGQVVIGTITFIIAQLLTFIFVERIYHAGRSKLLTYRWFAWIIGRIVEVRDWVFRSGRWLYRWARVMVKRWA